LSYSGSLYKFLNYQFGFFLEEILNRREEISLLKVLLLVTNLVVIGLLKGSVRVCVCLCVGVCVCRCVCVCVGA